MKPGNSGYTKKELDKATARIYALACSRAQYLWDLGYFDEGLRLSKPRYDFDDKRWEGKHPRITVEVCEHGAEGLLHMPSSCGCCTDDLQWFSLWEENE